MRKLFFILLFIPTISFSQDVYWRFNNSLADDMVGYDLTAINSAGFTISPKVEGTHAGNVNIISGSRFVTSAVFNFGTGGMTMNFAFFNSNTSGYSSLFDTRNGGNGIWIFADLSSNTLYVQTTDGTTTGTIGSANSAWTTGDTVFVQLRFMNVEGNYARLRINGAWSGTDTTLYSGWNRNQILCLGGNNGGGSFYGVIDNWSIYLCALSIASMDDIYANQEVDYSGYASCSGYPPEPPVDADTLYVDAISGNDANNGSTKAMAIQTIDRANDLYLSYDVIAFSDTAHYGSLDLNAWYGSQLDWKKITTYNLYGNGKASLKGIKQLTSWTSLGSNLWSKIDYDLPDMRYFQISENSSTSHLLRYKYFLNGIFIDGNLKNIAIEPDFQESGGVVYNYPEWRNESVAEDFKTSMTDNNRSMSINQFQGGYVYVCNEGWVGTKVEITSNNANTFYFNTYDFYFHDLYSETNSYQHWYRVMNHVNCLDQNGEFVYDYNTNKVTLYSTTDPASLEIYVPYVDNVIRLVDCNNVVIDNIEVWSGNITNINIDDSENIIISNSNLYYGGYAAISGIESQDIRVYNDSIMHSNGNGVAFNYNTGGREMVDHCYFYDIGNDGINQDRDGYVGNAIFSRWSDAERYFQNNYMEHIGGNGIGAMAEASTETNIYIYRNLVRDFNTHLGDGGGIYSVQQQDNIGIKMIRSNIVDGSIGGPWGSTMDFSMGIYLDLNSYYWTVDSNSISNVPIGIFTQYGNDYNNFIANKIAYTSKDGRNQSVGGYTGGFFKEGTGDDITNITFKKNQIVHGYTTFHNYENCVQITNDGSPYYPYSVIDSNYYFTPFSTSGTPFLSKGVTFSFYNMAMWYSFTGWEQHSTLNQQSIMFADVDTITQYDFVYFPRNWSSENHYFDLGKCAFKTMTGTTVRDSILISPFSSTLLFYSLGDISTVEDQIYIPIPFPSAVDAAIQLETWYTKIGTKIRKYFYKVGLKLNTFRR